MEKGKEDEKGEGKISSLECGMDERHNSTSGADFALLFNSISSSLGLLPRVSLGPNAGTLPPLRVLQPSKKTLNVVGMFNLGNSCFINALLQALSSCQPVVTYMVRQTKPTQNNNIDLDLLKDDTTWNSSYGDNVLCAELARTLLLLQPRERSESASGGTLNVRKLRGEVLKLASRFESSQGEQQDSDELFYLLLEAVDRQVSRATRAAAQREVVRVLTTPRETLEPLAVGKPMILLPPNPFQGTIMSQMACTRCGTVTPLHGTIFRALPLTLVDESSHSLLTTLSSALENFVRQEIVEDVVCSGLCKGTRRSMYRRCSLGKVPQVFCIHLGRRHFNLATGQIVKLGHHVAFPMRMNFSRFIFHCNEVGPDMTRSLLHNFHALEMLETPRRSSSPTWSCGGGIGLYQLESVVVHHGSAYGGHFTAFRRLRQEKGDNAWVHISDDVVQPVEEGTVLRCQAYMLFYERIQ